MVRRRGQPEPAERLRGRRERCKLRRAVPDDASHRRENHEAPSLASSFETRAGRAPQDEVRQETKMVVLNRIYTRTGDDGTTALGSGERRPKYDLRVSAYGTVDETNAAIGVVRVHLKDSALDAMLGMIQNDLF